MVVEADMKDTLQQYLDGFNQGDAASIIALFADDARIEDPVGGGQVVKGEEAIATFYQQGVEHVKKLELDTPIRSSHGRSAAMAFTIRLEMDGIQSIIRTIDVMTFNESGKIVDMKAYHGPSDVSE